MCVWKNVCANFSSLGLFFIVFFFAVEDIFMLK